jgi:ribosome-binding factor A
MTTFRIQRINKQIQRDLSSFLETKVRNDFAKNAIITGVDCSRDLRYAKVYFTTIDPKSRDDVHKALREIAGLLRSFLAHSLPLRLIPELSFFPDTSEDYGRHIDSLLDTVISPHSGSENVENDDEDDEELDLNGDESDEDGEDLDGDKD